MLKPPKLNRAARRRTSWLAAATLSTLVAASQIAFAGEGGTSHIMPGGNATLVDLPPTSPGGFFKPMYHQLPGRRLGDACPRRPGSSRI